MRHVEPNGESPEAFMRSLHDLGDAKFESMFAEDPPLNDFSNAATERIRNDILGATGDVELDGETSSRLHFGVKKLVFLFTNPEDYDDTIQEYDIYTILSVMHAQSENLPNTIELVNRYANSCMTIYKPRTEAQTGEVWNSLHQTQKFWSVFGNFKATAESDGLV